MAVLSSIPITIHWNSTGAGGFMMVYVRWEWQRRLLALTICQEISLKFFKYSTVSGRSGDPKNKWRVTKCCVGGVLGSAGMRVPKRPRSVLSIRGVMLLIFSMYRMFLSLYAFQCFSCSAEWEQEHSASLEPSLWRINRSLVSAWYQAVSIRISVSKVHHPNSGNSGMDVAERTIWQLGAATHLAH